MDMSYCGRNATRFCWGAKTMCYSIDPETPDLTAEEYEAMLEYESALVNEPIPDVTTGQGIKTDTEYALGQLKRALQRTQELTSADCMSRACDALERILEAVKQEEIVNEQ